MITEVLRLPADNVDFIPFIQFLTLQHAGVLSCLVIKLYLDTTPFCLTYESTCSSLKVIKAAVLALKFLLQELIIYII